MEQGTAAAAGDAPIAGILNVDKPAGWTSFDVVAFVRRRPGARRGEAIEPAARGVPVDRLDIISFAPPFLRLAIECGKGFYVRSLAHDLGVALGVGGCLAGLRRTRVGPFRVEDAVDVETLRAEFESGAWQEG